LAITVTILSVTGVVHLLTPHDAGIGGRFQRIEALIGDQFAEVWGDSARRAAFAARLSDALSVAIRVEDAEGHLLEEHGGTCREPDHSVVVHRGREVLGKVHGCYRSGQRSSRPFTALAALLAAGAVLWLAAAALSKRLTRPLEQLIDVTRELGQGNLQSRVRLGRHHRGELSVLAESVNEMAERIERQLREQRELLAVVSHEVRSPLARLRISSELLRDDPDNSQALTAIEREVADIDQLVGKLLASSRLDFGSMDRVPLDPLALARTALERRALSATLLEDRTDRAHCNGDPTLVARALDNLLENAERHASAVERLVVRRAAPGEHKSPSHALVFEVWDRGPGFDPAALASVFRGFSETGRRSGTPTNKDDGHVSLGLGLSLVRRIAEAHGGRAWAENGPHGGARVSMSIG
jgi:signal transduction histidine kinase